jgi:PAS domain S-box-containing protein
VAPSHPLPPLVERLERCELRVQALTLAELVGDQALAPSTAALAILVETPGSLSRSNEACQQLRKLTSPHIPLLVLTARGEAAHVQGLYRVGATDFLTWPEDGALLEVRVEQALRQAEAEQELRLLRAAFEHTREAITITSANLEAPGPTILHTNAALAAMTGYSAEELRGHSPRLLQGPRTARQVLDELKRRLQAGQPFRGEAINYRKDRSEFWMQWEVFPVHDAQGAITHYVACQRDVTALHRAEQALHQSESRLRAAAEGSLDAFWILSAERDSQGRVVAFRVVDINKRGERLLGRSREQLLGQRLGEQVPALAQSGCLERYRQVLESGQVLEEERPPAPPFCQAWLYRQIIPLEEGVAVTMRDISARKAMEESLRRSETMSALGALVAGVAHEVRNPLFAISAALDAFENRFGSRPEYARYLEIFHQESERLGQLLGELLEYGRPPSAELAPSPLAPVLEEAMQACRLLAERQQVEIDWEPPTAELPAVSMERRRLVQVFQNLIQNALQYSPPGSRVRVRVEAVQGQGVLCTVEDRGPGFPPEDLPRLFEPFFSRRPRGVGLGLSIVHRIVEEHHGHVAMDNHPQGGARATVLLPCAGPPAGNVITRAQLPTAA